MNDDLKPAEIQKPFDWRFRNILIAYIIYYFIVVKNLLECVTLWYFLGLIISVIVGDVIESA